MKIHSTGRRGLNVVSSKKKEIRQSGFQTLLLNRLENIRTAQNVNPAEQVVPKEAEAWSIIEDAAHLLDKAMEQIHRGGHPDPDIVDSLQELRIQLNRNSTNNQIEEANAIIAVEAGRLQAWER